MCFIFNIYDAFFISKKTGGFLWITVLNLSIMHAWGANVLLLFLEFKVFYSIASDYNISNTILTLTDNTDIPAKNTWFIFIFSTKWIYNRS